MVQLTIVNEFAMMLQGVNECHTSPKLDILEKSLLKKLLSLKSHFKCRIIWKYKIYVNFLNASPTLIFFNVFYTKLKVCQPEELYIILYDKRRIL